MDIIQAIILGLVQGLTEFLPVSSSAHLIAIRWLLGWEDPGIAFDVAVHIGTLVAVLLYFRRDWVALLRGAFAMLIPGRRASEPQGRLAWYIVLACIPAAITGALVEEELEALFHGPTPQSQATGVLIIGVVMIMMAGLLFLAERTANHKYDMSHLTLRQTLVIGVAQTLAVIPGVSRSGSTITAGLFMNLKREAAARFSFLLGTPIILGAGLKQLYDLATEGGLPPGQTTLFLAGFLTAALSGYAAVFGLMRFLQRNSTLVFVAYRVVVGVLLIALALISLMP